MRGPAVPTLLLPLLLVPCAVGKPWADPELSILESRLVDAMLPPAEDALNSTARVSAAAETLASRLDIATGQWPDVSYVTLGDEGRSWWGTGVHLQRMLLLATAGCMRSRGGGTPGAVADAAVRATQHWLDANYINSNWWWNDFGTPRVLQKSLLLIRASGDPRAASLIAHPNATVIVKRCTWSYTGTNLVWSGTVHMLAGLLWGNTSLVDAAFSAAWSTATTLEPQGTDGLMADASWHQHGPLLYSGWGYGAIWSTHMLFLGNLSAGLRWSAQNDTASRSDTCAPCQGVEAMVLDGQRWMVRGPNFGWETCGRLVTYFANYTSADTQHINWGHYHYYAAFTAFTEAFPDFWASGLTPLAVGFAAYLDSPFTQSLARAAEMRAFGESLGSDDGSGGPEGCRVYWDSDYVVHRRANFSVTIRMHSHRTKPSDCGNEEGKQNRAVADGATAVYQSGREFEDIYPVWDWKSVPGTVEVNNATRYTCSQASGSGRRVGSFVGGVTDGQNGAAAMSYFADLSLNLHRTWLLLDDAVVVMGIGQCCGDGHASPTSNITVSLDQRLLGPGGVTYAAADAPDTLITVPYDSTAGPANQTWPRLGTKPVAWVHHGRAAFLMWPRGGLPVEGIASRRVGSWYDITQADPDSPRVEKDVFGARINLGAAVPRPGEADLPLDFVYAILPDVGGAAEVPSAAARLRTSVHAVENGWAVQGACWRNGTDSIVTAVSFWDVAEGVFAGNATAGCPDAGVARLVGDRYGFMVMMVVSDGGRRLGVVASSPDLVPNATAALYVRGAWTTPTDGKMGAAVACALHNQTHSLVNLSMPGGSAAGSSAYGACIAA